MKRKILLIIAVLVCLMFPLYVFADDVSENDTDIDDAVSAGNVASDTYYDVLIAKEAEEQNYELYRSQLNAQLADAKLEYLAALEAEWTEKYGIEEKKLELGYSTALAVAEVGSRYHSVRLQIESAEDLKAFCMDVITLHGGTYQEIAVSETWEPLEGDYVQSFLAGSAQKVSYEQQIVGYTLSLLAATPGTEEAIILEKQLQLAQLNLAQYEIDLQLYVKDLQLQYADIGRSVADLDTQIKIAEMQITNAKLLLEKGKITEMQLTELENELNRLKYERLSLIYDAQAILYILTHQIEGKAV